MPILSDYNLKLVYFYHFYRSSHFFLGAKRDYLSQFLCLQSYGG